MIRIVRYLKHVTVIIIIDERGNVTTKVEPP